MLLGRRLQLIALVFTCCFQTVACADMIINGDFELQPSFGSGAVGNDAGFSAMTEAQIPGWTIRTGHAVTVHNTVLYPFISGNYSLNLDGEGFNGRNADIYQDFTSVASTEYIVKYDYKGWVPSPTTFTVSITDLTTSAVLYSQTSNWSSLLVNVNGAFQGTGNNLRLNVFQQNTGFNDNAFIVDNFSVTAVPEPSSIVLLLSCSVFVFYQSVRKQMQNSVKDSHR